MRILFLMPYCPVPANSGNKNLTFNLLKYITNHANCDLVMLVEKGENQETLRAKITEEFPQTANIWIFTKESGYRSLWKRLQAILQGYHPALGRYSSQKLEIWLTQHLKKNSYDLVHIDMFYMVQYVNFIRSIPTLLVSSDAYSMAAIIARLASKNWLKKVSFWIQEILLKNYEINEYSKIHTVCSVSEIDRKYLSALAPQLYLKKIGIAVGKEYTINKPRFFPISDKSHPNILCTGAIYIPHIAVAFVEFLDNCYPKIVDKFPDITFTILGKNPDRKLTDRLQEFPLVKHIEYVEDYASFLEQDWVYIYPQRCGSGLQTKVQQAMAVGLPVVGFEQAFGGFEVDHGKQAYVCHSTEEMSERVIELLTDRHLRETIGNAAAEYIRESFSIEKIGNEMLNTYIETMSRHSTLIPF
jgi:glycosyltransferase involved in cell wall biosynthesis